MRWALVFSGQGMQHAGMLQWLPRNAMLLAVEARLGADWRERLADSAWAGNNAHAQYLLTGLALAAWAELSPLLPPPAIVAGYSVGEIAAFSAAGVFGPDTALALVARRAACMDDAAARAQVQTGLLAVSGAPSAIDALRQRFDLDLAIRNAADSVVLGGPRGALDTAAEVAMVQGLRCTPLNVALASHTRWMQPAAAAFADHLAAAFLNRSENRSEKGSGSGFTNGFAEDFANQAMALPQRMLVSNVRGRIKTVDQAREALAAQINSTVRWDECMDVLAAQQVRAVLEIGPGQALCRLWQQAHADVPARSADEFRSAAAVAAWLCKTLERAG